MKVFQKIILLFYKSELCMLLLLLLVSCELLLSQFSFATKLYFFKVVFMMYHVLTIPYSM